MSTQLSLIVLFAFIGACISHPMYHKQFHAVVDGHECLKTCMKSVRDYGHELSLLKNADFAHFFRHHELACEVIQKARLCIDECDVSSNPFTLTNLQVQCTEENVARIQGLLPCLHANETVIIHECVNQCGNHTALNNEVYDMTEALGEDVTNPAKVNPILAKTGETCHTYKCTARCNVAAVQEHCGAEAATDLRELLQSVLDANRADVIEHNVLETMKRSTPPQCNYLYTPAVVFNESADHESFHETHQLHHRVAAQEQAFEQGQLVQMRRKVLDLQFDVLTQQADVLQKENRKLEMELQLLNKHALPF